MTKQGFSFLLILQLLVLTCTSSLLFSQEWMEPVNVSNMPDHLNLDADMIIDNNGVIHVVWSMRMTNSLWWWNIMYTCSKDDGSTWAEPLDLLQNTDLWMSQPHINLDSKNHLYVTYDYSTGTPEKMVYLIVCDGFLWGEPILVSEGMPGSDYNKVVVDNYDRVFIFWGYQNIKIKYRIYQNNTFGEIMEPYYNSLSDYYYLYYYSIDPINNFHWIGYTTEAMPSGTFAHAYFILEPDLNEWSVPHNISVGKAEIGNDIDLSINDYPEVVIREDTTNWPTPYDDITFFMENDGSNWMPPNPVANTLGSQKNQQIAVDQNNTVHIVETEVTNISYNMVHYKKENDKWSRYVIDSTTNFCNPTKLIFHNNKLYLVYFKDSIPGTPDDDIFFTKYDIVTNINEETHQQPGLKIYPNPASGSISIEFENSKEQEIELSVYDITGKHIITLINKNIPPGVQQILWNGKDKNGKEVKSGSYLVRLSYGRDFVSQTVEIVR